MSDKFRNMTLGKSGRGYLGPQEPELVREYSEETQKYIDEEIARLMEERYAHVLAILGKHRNLLEYIAKRLLEKESMDKNEFEEIIKAESHCAELEAEAGKKAEDERYVNSSALASVLSPEEPYKPVEPTREISVEPAGEMPVEPLEKKTDGKKAGVPAATESASGGEEKPKRKRTVTRTSRKTAAAKGASAASEEKPKRRGRPAKKKTES